MKVIQNAKFENRIDLTLVLSQDDYQELIKGEDLFKTIKSGHNLIKIKIVWE